MPEETPNEKPTTEIVQLHTAGSVPGIPGSHGPGRYLVNWLTREITPIVDEVEQVVEDIMPKSKNKTTAPTDAADITVKES